MKTPVTIIWKVIGDVFSRDIFFDDSRRPVEALWQVMSDSAADALKYVDYWRKARNVFEVEATVPYGTFGTSARPIETNYDSDGVLLGGRQEDFWNWFIYIEDETIPPQNGYIEVFSSDDEPTPCASIAFDSSDFVNLMSGGTVINVGGSALTPGVPWEETENPSYVFGPDMALDGTQRWEATGSAPPTAAEDGLSFDALWTSWSILRDQYYFDAGQNWKQIWRFRINEWDTNPIERHISLSSFGDLEPSFEMRFRSEDNQIFCEYGKYAKTFTETLAFSGSTISRTYGSFVNDGWVEDLSINVSGSGSNDGTYTVVSVTATTITVAESFVSENVVCSLAAELDSMTGSTAGWHADIVLATEADPRYVEFILEYSASSATLSSSIWYEGERVTQPASYKVKGGRRRHVVDVLNQLGSIDVEVDFLISEGKLWNATTDTDFSSSIGKQFTFTYEVDEPLVDSNMLRSDPWDLPPPAEVVSVSGQDIYLTLDEDWAEYAPEHARITNDAGEWVSADLVSQDGLDLQYRILRQCDVAVDFEGEVKLKPWYLNPSEYVWIEESIFGTSHPLPWDENRLTWFTETQASGLQMYERYGRILGLGRQSDSQEYLNIIRGFQYGLLSEPTARAISNAIGVMSSLPYVIDAGILSSVTRFRDELGASLYDEVVVGGRAYRIDPIWNDLGLLKPIGTKFEFLSPMVDGVTVVDYISDLATMQRVVDDPWGIWGTFLIQIPSSVGVNLTIIQEVTKMVKRAKPKEAGFLVEYQAFENENQATGDDRMTDYSTHEMYGHTIEDMIFDDDGTVYQNPMNYQTIGGALYSAEYQTSDPSALDDGDTLDQFVNLDSDPLVINDVKLEHRGTELGPAPSRPNRRYAYRDSGTDLKRDLGIAETDAGFSKTTLRMSKPNDTQTYFNRPYELCWVFTGASPQFSVRDGGGAFATYKTLAWEDVSPAEVDDLHAAYIQDANFAYVVGDNGAIWETTDYGQNWTDKSIATTDDFRGAHSGWVVGTNSAAYELVGSVWTSRTVDVGTFVFEDIYWVDSQTGFIAGHDDGAPATSYIWRTIDGGSNWSVVHTLADGGGGNRAKKIHFDPTGTYGWVAASDGLQRSVDGGATWSSTIFESGNDCTSVFLVDTSTLYYSFGNSIGVSTNADAAEGDVTFTTSVVSTGTINDMHMQTDGLRGSIGSNSGETVLTDDGWSNVTVDTQGANTYYGVHHQTSFFRLMTGSAGKVLRWK